MFALAAEVCIRTLTRSNGCPTRTAHAPPTPPATKDLSAESANDIDVVTCIDECVDGKCETCEEDYDDRERYYEPNVDKY
jgi:hypothetical protein